MATESILFLAQQDLESAFLASSLGMLLLLGRQCTLLVFSMPNQ